MPKRRPASPRSRTLRVRVQRREHPDIQRIGRAVIELALQASTANTRAPLSATNGSEESS